MISARKSGVQRTREALAREVGNPCFGVCILRFSWHLLDSVSVSLLSVVRWCSEETPDGKYQAYGVGKWMRERDQSSRLLNRQCLAMRKRKHHYFFFYLFIFAFLFPFLLSSLSLMAFLSSLLLVNLYSVDVVRTRWKLYRVLLPDWSWWEWHQWIPFTLDSSFPSGSGYCVDHRSFHRFTTLFAAVWICWAMATWLLNQWSIKYRCVLNCHHIKF